MKKQWSFIVGAALACSQMVWAGTTKYFSVLLPDWDDWKSSVPMLSTDGGVTGKPMNVDPYLCGWFTLSLAEDDITDNVVIFRDDDSMREDVLGVNGDWETSLSPTPIPLKMIYGMGVDSLFFVADANQKDNADGFYYSFADVYTIEGTCYYTLTGIVYDTDPSLHPAFSCYSELGEGCQKGAQGVDSAVAVTAVDACVGITPGIVESTLDPTTKKPKLTKAGQKCFISEQYFNQLFSYTQGVNEKSCFDIPFHRSLDGKWEFYSDYYVSPGTTVPGGFYPVEKSTDETVLLADPTQTPVAAARTRRDAEGPVFYGEALRKIDPTEGVPVIDLFCKGPGWDKGVNCDGYFGDGDATTTFIQTSLGLDTGYRASNMRENCVFGWSCSMYGPEDWQYYKPGTETPYGDPMAGEPRWRSVVKEGTGGRNQHYCMESHSKFTYKPGFRFTFSGSDDLWVFIDNKLAVDLGGTHIPAPAYVDLDKFEGLNGALMVGENYDMDIFFCDRRTAMNGLRIKTNAYTNNEPRIRSTPTKSKKNRTQTNYEICYTVKKEGACEETVVCDSILDDPDYKISYTLVRSDKVVEDFDKVTKPGVYKCGIDLTNMANPKVDLAKVCLDEGSYTLFVNVGGKTSRIAKFLISPEGDAVKAHRVVAKSFRTFTHGNSIAIVASDNSAAKFTVMNALGAVVRSGNLQQGRAVVPALASGSYIVKVARETRRVNVR